ncbi:MAG: leucine-rich repeat domain-containing protein [Alphaproteobacteria bacterium]|nr:leucine-rich repeat domain-containing protein [Alphaproteobacteria bacterium]
MKKWVFVVCFFTMGTVISFKAQAEDKIYSNCFGASGCEACHSYLGAEATIGSNCYYAIQGDTITIYGPTEKSESGFIPEKAFLSHDVNWISTIPENVKNLEIKGNITEIKESAFNRSPLTNVVLPDSISIIGTEAFLHAQSLQGIVIPDTVTSIEKGAFYDIGDVVYCHADKQDLCANGILRYNGEEGTARLETYAITENNIYQTSDGKLFATLDLMAHGAACTSEQNCIEILNSNGNSFKVGSKIYNSLADFANGNYVRHRIYTIDEANAVAGEKNRVSITYR